MIVGINIDGQTVGTGWPRELQTFVRHTRSDIRTAFCIHNKDEECAAEGMIEGHRQT